MSKKIQLTLNFDQEIDLELNKMIKGIVDFRILSSSLDARGASRGKKPQVHYQIEYIESGDQFTFHQETFANLGPLKNPPIIIGAGPAGLFTALRLLEYGIPSIIFERGESAHKRMISIAKFWRQGILNPESNVCFGEGGAGLFSDGKLITRVKSPFVKYVMQKFVDFGAPKEIAYASNPHVGSNLLRNVIKNISKYLNENGCQIYFETPVNAIVFDKDGMVKGIKTHRGEFASDQIILATGHSAKDIYSHLHESKVTLEAKDFAIGVRVEHPREVIDRLQYGKFSNNEKLETAKYRLSYHNEKTDRGTYSFCMCPGGHVLSTGTEKEGLVTNGMSNYNRFSPWSNSAIIVSVKRGIDFSLDGNPLDGIRFQQRIEHNAFLLSKEIATGKELPAIKLTQFLEGKNPHVMGMKTSCPSGIFANDFSKILPEFITNHIRQSFEHFNRNLSGYISDKALLIAPETRTSSAVRIMRDKESFESVSSKGLYPAGEGAGYAGGITSAATDGVHVAMAIIQKKFGLEPKI